MASGTSYVVRPFFSNASNRKKFQNQWFTEIDQQRNLSPYARGGAQLAVLGDKLCDHNHVFELISP